jgi:choline dehydrogenase-like flavoprotein
MIIDLNAASEIPVVACDICIVGSGAAGLAIASEMFNAQLRVVLLESGGMEFEPATQALYDAEMSGLPHPGTRQGRFRVCGGSTTKWGGQTLPLMPSDFEPREWVSHSGWPITFEEMLPYYSRAYRFLQVDQMNFDSDLFAYLRTTPPAMDSKRVWYHFSKWSPQPSVREIYLPWIAASDRCTLMLHANVSDICLEPNLGRVNEIQVCSLTGKKATVRARTFVICAGGIETARLLMANNRQHTKGIGNEHDLVGRFFQDHPNAMVGWLKSSDAAKVQRYFNVFHKRGLKYSVRLTATSQWQRENRTLNASMGVIFVQENGVLQHLKDSYLAIRNRRVNREVLSNLLRIAGNPSAAASPIWHYLVKGRSYAPGAKLQICLTCEQEPNPESRVLLSDKRDALGIRQANVRWQLTELTRHTMQKFSEALHDEFRRVGLGEMVFDPWLHDNSPAWLDHINDQFHHMGTTRMHDSPHEGVVDRDCRVHGIANLYVGSSAVFPTSGHSNPTLTIIALCMRLSDRLKDELG